MRPVNFLEIGLRQPFAFGAECGRSSARSEYLASQIPGAQFYFFVGKGHAPHNSAPDEFCRVLRDFIRTGSAKPATQSEAAG